MFKVNEIAAPPHRHTCVPLYDDVDVVCVINSVANSAAGKFEQRSLRKILLKLTYLPVHNTIGAKSIDAKKTVILMCR